MSIFSDEFRNAANAETNRYSWAAKWFGEHTADVEQRMELAIRLMAVPVSHSLLGLLGSTDMRTVLKGIGAYWTIVLAGMDGWHATDCDGSGVVRANRGAGEKVVFVPLMARTASRREIQLARLNMVAERLKNTIWGRRFVLHLKKPLPEDFDPLVLVEPIQNWLSEIERGQWTGGYAIYDDGDVVLELCLLDEVLGEGPGRMLFHVPPLAAERTLSELMPQMVHRLENQQRDDNLVVFVFLGQNPWRWNASLLLSVLYGRCIEANSCGHEEMSYRFAPGDVSLMANPLGNRIGAVWWLQPSNSDALAEGVAYRNPWRLEQGSVPSFPGVQFSGVREGTELLMVKKRGVFGDVELPKLVK
jgi:hypothetical protein